MKPSDEPQSELRCLARQTIVSARVVTGALLTWVPWTAIRFAVCWSVPIFSHGRLPKLFTDAPNIWLLLFPFLVELIVPAWYVMNAVLGNTFDDTNLEASEEAAMIRHDILALRYRLMRPGIITFVAHLVLMPFSPAMALVLSPIPWALSLFWWDGRLPWFAMRPQDDTQVFFRHLYVPLHRGRGKPRLTAAEAQAVIDTRPQLWKRWFGQ